MTCFERLNALMLHNDGMLQTAQAIEAGISKPVFYEYIKAKNLKRAAHGVYILENAWLDSMFLLQLRCKQAVFSHETALLFHDLTDREPERYSVTLKRGYGTARLRKDNIIVYTVKKELYPVGIIEAKTPFGNRVWVYDAERTICDLLRSRSQIEIQTLQTALKGYAGRKGKNLQRLMRYAKLFRVEKILKQYLRVLL